MATFDLSFIGDKEKTYKCIKNAVSKAKGEFEGNNEKGDFSIPVRIGRIVGKYTLLSDKLKVEIKKKPYLLSSNKIRKVLQKYMEQQA